MFLEVFAGCSVLTLTCLCTMIPAVRPWDLAFDESNNVLANGWIIFWLVSLGRLVWVHLGMPCQSFTKARQVQLRDWLWPSGIPNLAAWRQELIDAGNALLAWTVLLMSHCQENKAYACLKNPWPCWTFIQPEILNLWFEDGWIVTTVTYDTCGCCTTHRLCISCTGQGPLCRRRQWSCRDR